MIIEFKRTVMPTSPTTIRWLHTINGEPLGYLTRTDLEVLRDAALSDLKAFDGFPEEALKPLRLHLAALNKALEEVAA